MTTVLKSRLIEIMKSWPMPINPGCEYNLEKLIDESMARVEAGGFSSDPQKLNEAESNFKKLLAEMTWEAGRQGYTELHEPTLFAALARICPLFPFC